MDKSELREYKLNNRKFIVDAYTAKYYSDDSVNILCEPIDYILDNFHELEKLFDIFTDNSIVTADIKRKNAILSHSGIIIIDPDTFYISALPKRSITIENKRELLFLFKSILSNSMKNMENCHDMLRKISFDLDEVYIDSKTDIAYGISKELKHVKWPREYLKK